MKLKKTLNKLLISTFILFLSNSFVFGQSLKISVKNGQKKALNGATIQLIKIADSTIVNGLTDKTGLVEIKDIQDGLYSVKISYIGYQPLIKSIVVKSDKRLFDFFMFTKETSLKEVSITARKPLITQEDDKMIIDTEPMANTSTNTLEVLENTPGIYVDQDGGI